MVEAGDVESVSMRAIAEAVGVTPPAIYLHFSDKDQLFEAICEERFRLLNATFVEATSGGGTAIERLMRCGRAYVRFGIDHPEAYRFLMMTKSDDDYADTFTTDQPSQGDMAFMFLVNLVTECIEAGDIRPMDPLEASLVIWSHVHGLTALMITEAKFEWPETVIDTLLETTMYGVCPR